MQSLIESCPRPLVPPRPERSRPGARVALAVALLLVSSIGCGDTDDAPDASGRDASVETDAQVLCRGAEDCDDGRFCNGAETCAPTAAAAGADGCVVGANPCPDSECSETERSCVESCDEDRDLDGHTSMSCGGLDCDDEDGSRHPSAAERCDLDAHDEDCNPATVGEVDRDGDGFVSSQCCNGATCGPDCDDATASVSPDDGEVCNGVDDDCDGAVDESATVLLYPDLDGDLHGDARSAGERLCPDTAGFATLADDCDDADPRRYPGQAEVCNGIDDDCNGALDGPSEDDDHDGFGDRICGAAAATDCDDADPNTFPGAPELCDGRINDCAIGSGPSNAEDRDRDGHVASTSSCLGRAACDALPPPTVGGRDCTRVLPVDDCRDTAATVYAGASELCDGLDTDCDSQSDEAARGLSPCFAGVACFSGGCGAMRAIDAGTATTCGVDRDGRARCWGWGFTSTVAWTTPTVVPALSGVSAVDVGETFACAIRTGNELWCWGVNDLFQLNASTPDTITPARRTTTPVVQVAVGQSHGCALTTTGTVICWGNNSNRQTGYFPAGGAIQFPQPVIEAGGIPLNGVVEIAAGGLHTCARMNDATVRCWGLASSGQLGNNDGGSMAPVVGARDVANATQITAGSAHSCALLADRTIRCWGNNAYGQLGDGSFTSRDRGVAVIGISDAVQVSASGDHTCARHANGRVSCWGQGYTRGSGFSEHRHTPALVSPTGVIDVAAGYSHSCVLQTDGRVQCWGSVSSGQLGNGSTSGSATTTPTRVSGLDG